MNQKVKLLSAIQMNKKILNITINDFPTLSKLINVVRSLKSKTLLVSSKNMAENNLKSDCSIRHFWYEYDKIGKVYILHETLYD